MSKQLGRNKIAQEAHFRKAGPTEKTGHEKIKAERQADKLDEQEALREAQIPEEADESALEHDVGNGFLADPSDPE